MADVRPPWRIPLLILGFASLIIGVGAGLLRLGWAVPRPAADLAAFHGPLMVSGFFGTVISLERAVALAQRWAYLGPLAAGVGGLSLTHTVQSNSCPHVGHRASPAVTDSPQ